MDWQYKFKVGEWVYVNWGNKDSMWRGFRKIVEINDLGVTINNYYGRKGLFIEERNIRKITKEEWEKEKPKLCLREL